MKLSHALACVTFFFELIGSSRADEKYDVTTRTSSASSGVTNLATQDYRSLLVSNEDEGENIYGGTPTNGQEYPFYVQPGSEASGFCGGSLVAADMVLTAAHCESVFNGSITVLVGAYERGSTSNGTAQWRKITSRMIVHPSYNDQTMRNDIMLFKIEPVTLENLKPIELNWDSNNPSKAEQVTAIGMGEKEDGKLSDVLLKVTLNIVKTSECNAAWNGDIDGSMQVCASTTEGKDTCGGDSGGPLFDANNVQVGLVSYGPNNPCADGIRPGVYTRISEFKDWIQGTFCAYSDTSPSYCPTGSLTPFKVTVLYDSYPDEYAWKIKDLTTNQLVANYPINRGIDPYSKLKLRLSLPQGHRFIVIAKDSSGDGLSNGSLRIVKKDENGTWKLVTLLTGQYKRTTFVFDA